MFNAQTHYGTLLSNYDTHTSAATTTMRAVTEQIPCRNIPNASCRAGSPPPGSKYDSKSEQEQGKRVICTKQLALDRTILSILQITGDLGKWCLRH